MNRWKDTLGILASVACAIHCAATPILLAFLPALKFTEWMASPQFHQAAAIVCVGLVSISIWPAFRLFRDFRVLGLSTAGLGLVITAAFFLPDQCCSHAVSHVDHSHTAGSSPVNELSHAGHSHAGHSHASETTLASTFPMDLLVSLQPWMTPLGGLMLVLAHGLNLRRRFGSCERGCACHKSKTAARVKTIEIAALGNVKAA
ncbi:MAG: MerC domain-containing protein [Planctomycetota bacterium]|nr:MerC domain-containing protein [Planctomycetota bacterium]